MTYKPTYEELVLVKENVCEDCKGKRLAIESDCWQHCDGFQAELEELKHEE